jgi:hypothetical protein
VRWATYGSTVSESWITQFGTPHVRNSPVACAVCGCRLTPASGSSDSGWRHLPSLDRQRDARGCRPACIEGLHDADGLLLDRSRSATALP